jgi:hypothetical protein
MKQALLLFFLLLLNGLLLAQKSADSRLLNVYIDRFSPPENLYDLQQEFPFINYTTQSAEGEVQVLRITDLIGNLQERNGLCFFGFGRFSGQNDTIWYIIPPITPELQRRELLNNVFKKGIYPYLEQCEYEGNLEELIGKKPAVEEDLSWNKTSYTLNAQGNFGGSYNNSNQKGFLENKSISKSNEFYYELGAEILHFTKKWRYNGVINFMNYNYNNQTLNQDTIFSTSSEFYDKFSTNCAINRALSNHFSIGANLDYFYYKSLNFQKNTNASVGFEYNLFPYSEFFRRRMTLSYFTNYIIYNSPLKLPITTHWSHTISLDYFKQLRWGFLGFGIDHNVRFNPETFRTFNTNIKGNIGFHLGKNLFLSLSGRYLRDNLFSLEKFGYSNNIYINKSRHNYLNMSVGLTYLFGAGLRNNLPLGLDALTYESWPFFKVNKMNEGWNRWSFNLGGFGKFKMENYSSQLPKTDVLYEKNSELTISPSFQMSRVGRHIRNSTAIEFEFTKRNQLKDGEQLKWNRTTYHLFQNLVFTFKNRFSVGAKIDISNMDYGFNNFSDFDNVYRGRTSFSLGLEYNFISYKHYLRKNWNIGYYHNFLEEDFWINTSGSDDTFFTSAFRLTKWGYWQVHLSHNSNLLNNPHRVFSIRSDSELGWNVKKSLYLTLNPYLSVRYSKIYRVYFQDPNYATIELNDNYIFYSTSIGIKYYFGQGKTNVINPRMSRRF